MKTYAFDLDNTLCWTDGNDYKNSIPNTNRIGAVNNLYWTGNKIKIYTARGMGAFEGDLEKIERNYGDLTRNQLKEWGLEYSELIFGKESYDFIIDDKAIAPKDFFDPTVGIMAGAFDVIHPGYILAFKECKKYVEELVIALHDDQSLEKGKLKPILYLEERREIMYSISFVDQIVTYSTEEELEQLILKYQPNVRFLGDDYKEKKITGDFGFIRKIYLDRSHNWSTTKFKELIQKQMNEK